MFVYYHQQRVNYSETDQMGCVNYANYGFYYEQARAEAIRFLGVTYKDLEESGIITPITRMNIKYIQPAFYDEVLTVKTIFAEMPKRILRINYQIFNERKLLINQGDTDMIFAQLDNRQLTSAPVYLLEKLQPFFENNAHRHTIYPQRSTLNKTG